MHNNKNNEKNKLDIQEILIIITVCSFFTMGAILFVYEINDIEKTTYEIIKDDKVIDICEHQSYNPREYTECEYSQVYVPGDEIRIKVKYENEQ